METSKAELLKAAGLTCRSCWWQEGGYCFKEPCERVPNPKGFGTVSTNMATEVCEYHTSKRSVLEQIFPLTMLKIASEENEKKKGNDTGIY